MELQDSEVDSVVRSALESPVTSAAAHKLPGHDADSSGQSDNDDPSEEMSDVLKKDPIISKYSKYRITKKTPQQKSSCTYSAVQARDLFAVVRVIADSLIILSILWIFTAWMSFLSPNQQCHSTERRLHTSLKKMII